MPFDLEAAIREAEPPPAYAVIHPDDPRYADWMADLGTDAIPVSHSSLHLGEDVEGRPTLFLNVDAGRLDADQRSRIARRVAARFDVPLAEVEADIARGLLPIRAEGLFVCADPDLGRQHLASYRPARRAAAAHPERN